MLCKNDNKYEELLFPEIKQFHKIKSKLRIVEESKRDKEKSYIKIRDEVFRRGIVAEESLYVKTEDEIILKEVISEIEHIRREKSLKKIINHSESVSKKEIRFNKVYDGSDLPSDLRKAAYKKFVLDNKSYLKDIKLNKIKKFLSSLEVHENKDIKKKLIKMLESFVNENSDSIEMTNYEIKVKESISLKYHNLKVERFITVLNLDKEISKNKKRLIDDPELIFDIIKENRLSCLNKEVDRINNLIGFIKEKVDIKNLNKEILQHSVENILDIYNKEDALYKFVLTAFIKYSFKANYFSKKQCEVFVNRRKFRNRVNISLAEQEIETCIYLRFKEVKKSFVDLINNGFYLDVKDFYEWIKKINEEKINKHIDYSKNAFNKEIKYNIENSIKTENKKEVIKSSSYEKLLKNLIIKNLGRPPENRRLEITSSRIKEIFIGERDEIKSLVDKALLEQLLKIEYKNTFKVARGIKRKFKFFIGQTNSGKTYKAFNELAKYDSGCYLSPLRLLALEGQEEIEKRGKKCNMLTGEEKHIVHDAKFTSSTIEMINTSEEVECIIIDEIQMLKDENRGWAWTQAMIGAPAENIILAGSEDALDLVKKLVEYTGDELEVERLERKSPLKMLNKVSDLKNISKGTAIIAFSRRDVIKYKMMLKGRKTSTIYGNLGPEVRKEESRRFREGETDILIATDAIAMGLNLPIETVLFSTHKKTIRGEKFELEEQLVKQISGRAGRYGIKNVGYVGAINKSTLQYVKGIVNKKISDNLNDVYIKPNLTYLEQVSEITGEKDFSKLLELFKYYIDKNKEDFKCTDIEKMIELYEEIKDFNLSLKESLVFCSAPIKENNEDAIFYFKKYVSMLVENFYLGDTEKRFVKSPSISKFTKKKHTTDMNMLKRAEENLQILDLYNWFMIKYEDIFTDHKECEKKKDTLNRFIINSLSQINQNKKAKKKK